MDALAKERDGRSLPDQTTRINILTVYAGHLAKRCAVAGVHRQGRPTMLLALSLAPVSHAAALVFDKATMPLHGNAIQRILQSGKPIIGKLHIPCAQVLQDPLLVL